MKKNKIMYLFLFILLSFSFTANVYAAQKLTCVYKQGKNKGFVGFGRDIKKVILVQYENGTIEIYKNKDDVSITEKGWESSKDKYEFDASVLMKDGYLTSCPNSKSTLSDGSGRIIFYKDKDNDDENDGRQSLEASFNSLPKINNEQAEKDNNNATTNGGSCTGQEDFINNDSSTATLMCLYGSSNYNANIGCSLIQINFSHTSKPVFYSKLSSSNVEIKAGTTVTTDWIISEENVMKEGDCPDELYINEFYDDLGNLSITTNFKYESSWKIFKRIKTNGKNLKTGEDAKNENSNFNFEIEFNEIPTPSTCKELFGNNDALIDLLAMIINMVKILIPIILIVLGSLDFAQAIFAANEDGIKKAQQKFIKRLIIAVVIFLIPSILKVILTIANQVWEIDTDLCGLI